MNNNELKALMTSRGLKACDMAKMINITNGAMSNKLNGRSEFKASEIVKISQILGIPCSETETYFFKAV